MSKRMLQMLAVLIAVVALLGFIKFQQIQAAIAGGKAWAPPPETVTTVVAQTEDWPGTLEAVGSAEPVQGVTLSADLPGVVDRVEFNSGAYVRAGQVLVSLDARQEKAQLAAAEAQRDFAKTNLDRAKSLIDQKAISQSEFDQISALYKQADAQAMAFQAAIARKTIHAPFSGRTGIRTVNLGQYVNSGDPIVPLQALDPMYVDFSVPQQQAGMIKTGARVEAVADSGVNARLSGRVTAINPVVNDATRNVQVQATFRNPHGLLRAGMYVTVRVLLGTHTAVVALPVSAINYAPYGNSVFVVEDIKGPDGKTYKGVRQQFVKLGAAQGDQVGVLTGIASGQEVVTSGVFKLRTGAAVVVDNKTQPSNSPAPKPEES